MTAVAEIKPQRPDFFGDEKVEQALDRSAERAMETQLKKAARMATKKPTAPARIQPDSQTVVFLTAALVTLILVAAFAVSFAGQMSVAAWAGMHGVLQFAVPVAIDSVILVFTLAALVQRSRGDSTVGAWLTVGAFTLVSVAFNVLHVLVPALDTTVSLRDLIGSLVSGLMPMLILLATHMATNLLVAPPQGNAENRKLKQLLADRGEVRVFADPQSHIKGTPARLAALQLIAALKSSNMKNSEIARELGTDPTRVKNALAEYEKMQSTETEGATK